MCPVRLYTYLIIELFEIGFQSLPWMSRSNYIRNLDFTQNGGAHLDGWKKEGWVISPWGELVFVHSYSLNLTHVDFVVVQTIDSVYDNCFIFRIESFPWFWNALSSGFCWFAGDRNALRFGWVFRSCRTRVLDIRLFEANTNLQAEVEVIQVNWSVKYSV